MSLPGLTHGDEKLLRLPIDFCCVAPVMLLYFYCGRYGVAHVSVAKIKNIIMHAAEGVVVVYFAPENISSCAMVQGVCGNIVLPVLIYKINCHVQFSSWYKKAKVMSVLCRGDAGFMDFWRTRIDRTAIERYFINADLTVAQVGKANAGLGDNK